ncbi:ChaN family lipoprotein [Kamptonema cortianum]|nr:ChaN family lipoprotein [Geitlerinema splendidum]MDK3157605.1 ChaN family lipoprotein [Kamptonema cortianum]
MPILSALALTLLQPVDPYLLKIGTPGTIAIKPGYQNAKSGEVSTPDEIARAADGVKYFLIGENHATPAHHQAQADMIRAFHRRGRHVIVGFEMFTRDNQRNINSLSLGRISVDDFKVESNWEKQWGHNFDAYRPILNTVRDLGLPMVALNVPRDWVRQATRTGYASFDDFQKRWVPELYLGNKEHRMVFDALMGGHPMPEAQAQNIYSGQVTWDTGMAQSALDAMSDKQSDKWIMVILAGSGHVMYGQGINYRLKRMANADSLSLICIQGADSGRVSKGIGDYLYVGK